MRGLALFVMVTAVAATIGVARAAPLATCPQMHCVAGTTFDKATCSCVPDLPPIPKPCVLICPSDTILDDEQCKCVKGPLPIPTPCGLVCGPDETLDAKQCKCLKP